METPRRCGYARGKGVLPNPEFGIVAYEQRDSQARFRAVVKSIDPYVTRAVVARTAKQRLQRREDREIGRCDDA